MPPNCVENNEYEYEVFWSSTLQSSVSSGKMVGFNLGCTCVASVQNQVAQYDYLFLSLSDQDQTSDKGGLITHFMSIIYWNLFQVQSVVTSTRKQPTQLKIIHDGTSKIMGLLVSHVQTCHYRLPGAPWHHPAGCYLPHPNLQRYPVCHRNPRTI